MANLNKRFNKSLRLKIILAIGLFISQFALNSDYNKTHQKLSYEVQIEEKLSGFSYIKNKVSFNKAIVKQQVKEYSYNPVLEKNIKFHHNRLSKLILKKQLNSFADYKNSFFYNSNVQLIFLFNSDEDHQFIIA